MAKKRNGYHIPNKKQRKEYTFVELYVEYNDYLVKMLRLSGDNPMDAEDIVQTTFERVLKYWDKVIQTRIEGMLHQMLMGARHDFYESEGGFRAMKDGSASYEDAASTGLMVDPLKLMLKEELASVYEDSFNWGQERFTKLEAQVFKAYYVDGISATDYAKQTGKSGGHIRRTLEDIRKKLRYKSTEYTSKED